MDVGYVEIGRRWISAEITCVQGPLHMRAWRGDGVTWYGNAYIYECVNGERKIVGHHSIEAPSVAFPTHAAAIAAMNAWADNLGPVEPVLALFAYFRFDRALHGKAAREARRAA